MLWMMLISLCSAAPRGFAGLDWRPLSRQDLVWVENNRTSGTAVGEFDGTVKPVLGAFGGLWFNRYVGLSLSLGLARLDRASVADDVKTKTFHAVVRPALDVRIGWMEPRLRFPVPWIVIGVSGDIPAAKNHSTDFSDEEAQAAADAAAITRYRLGGVGGRVGLGLDYRLLPGFVIGAQITVGVHRAAYLGPDDQLATLWIATEASLLLSWEWNGPKSPLHVRRETMHHEDGGAPSAQLPVAAPEPAQGKGLDGIAK